MPTFAAVLLFSGGLVALQQMAITAAQPFTLIMCLMCYALMRALHEEKAVYNQGKSGSAWGMR
ncbi:MAG: BCCT family transporter [Bacillota bacterium]|jgi:glycine betaine transporter